MEEERERERVDEAMKVEKKGRNARAGFRLII